MNNLTARIARWDVPNVTGKSGKTTKRLLREHAHHIEFARVPTPGSSGGTYFTLDEVKGSTVEVRFNNDRDVAIIEVHPSGAFKVR